MVKPPSAAPPAARTLAPKRARPAKAATAVTLADVTQRLLHLAEEAETLGEPAGLSLARAVLMDIAKLNGLTADKADAFAALSPEARKARILELEAKRYADPAGGDRVPSAAGD